jgi:hypothetical protein
MQTTPNRQPQQATSQHLGTLFLMHAAGTRITKKHCPHCQRETVHGKTVTDTVEFCLECIPYPVDQQTPNT